MLKAVALAVLVVAAYWPVRNAPALYEDAVTLEAQAFRMPTGRDLEPGRYVTGLTFWLDGLIEPSHAQFHRTNLIVHVMNAWLVWMLLRRMGFSELAFVASAIFLLHPIQTEAVSYISGRADLLMTSAILGCCIVALRGPWDVEHAALVLMLGLIALATKEAAVAVLGVLPLVLVSAKVDRSWLVAWAGLWIAVIAIWSGLAMMAYPKIQAINQLAPLDPVRYVAAQLAVVWAYLGLVVVPVGLSIEHDALSWPAWTHLAALIASVVAIGLAWKARKDAPAVAFGAGWVLLALLPRFVVQMPDLLYERQAYLAMVGVALLAAVGIQRVTHGVVGLSALPA